MENNLALWESVYRTDPAHTKTFKRPGGFSGTAIKPYWVAYRLTEVFGPCGEGWGFEEIKNTVVAGVWCSYVHFWYMRHGQKRVIPQWGQTQMEGTNKNGSFIDEEAPKKAITDGWTKAASMLGFGGDVHMGQFDDSKYVTETARLFQEQKTKQTYKANKERFAEIKEAILQSDDPGATWQEYVADITVFKAQNQQFYDDLVQAGAERRKQLQEQEIAAASYGDAFVNTPTNVDEL